MKSGDEEDPSEETLSVVALACSRVKTEQVTFASERNSSIELASNSGDL